MQISTEEPVVLLSNLIALFKVGIYNDNLIFSLGLSTVYLTLNILLCSVFQLVFDTRTILK